MLSKISQSEKDKYRMISLLWNLRKKTNKQREKRERNKPTKNRPLTIENELMFTRGEVCVGGGMVGIGDGDYRIHLS